LSTRRKSLPSTRALEDGLRALFAAGSTDGSVEVVARSSNVYSSTAPSEIVRCRVSDGRELKLLCKYSAPHANSFGHRRGGTYEAMVYRRILEPLGASAPALHGVRVDPATQSTWLVLEYVDGFSRGMSRDSMFQAAAWAAAFHEAAEAFQPYPHDLIVYDRDYYCGWAARTQEFAAGLPKRRPWLATVCARFVEHGPDLLGAQTTVIHGEYYPHNVLSRHHCEIHPVDWESAAVGAGEIDLASLTEGWPPAYASRCQSIYQQVRWPHGAPYEFGRALAAARVYLALRWLGESRSQTRSRLSRPYFEQLQRYGQELGWLN
jgi:phosphotransferase family enzyme